MADGTTSLPRAGTVEIIQEFGGAPTAPGRPILSPVIIGSSFQIVDQGFAGFYQGRIQVVGELAGTGSIDIRANSIGSWPFRLRVIFISPEKSIHAL